MNQLKRMKNWDYRSNVSYFVTITAKNRKHLFGEIVDGKMVLNQLGRFADQNLWNISKKSRFAVITEHIVMPDHIHAIIEIKTNYHERETNRFGGMPGKSLTSVVNHFKGRVTRYAMENNLDYGWQDRFHERIIKSTAQFENTREYIRNNPGNWGKEDHPGKKND